MPLSNYEIDNIALDKLKCTCIPLDRTPNDVFEFIPEDYESCVMTYNYLKETGSVLSGTMKKKSGISAS